MNRARKGTSELVSTMMMIAISIAAALAAAVYTNSVASSKMQEHGEEVAKIINKNNEDIIILHAEYDQENEFCNEPLVVWIYNAGTIDTKVVNVIIDD